MSKLYILSHVRLHFESEMFVKERTTARFDPRISKRMKRLLRFALF